MEEYSLLKEKFNIFDLENDTIQHLYSFNLKKEKNLSFYQKIDLKENPDSFILLIFKSRKDFILNIYDEDNNLISNFKNERFKSLKIIPKISGRIKYEFTNSLKESIYFQVGFDCKFCNVLKDKENKKLKNSLNDIKILENIRKNLNIKEKEINEIQIKNLKENRRLSGSVNKYIIIEIILVVLTNFIQIMVIRKLIRKKLLI